MNTIIFAEGTVCSLVPTSGEVADGHHLNSFPSLSNQYGGLYFIVSGVSSYFLLAKFINLNHTKADFGQRPDSIEPSVCFDNLAPQS